EHRLFWNYVTGTLIGTPIVERHSESTTFSSDRKLMMIHSSDSTVNDPADAKSIRLFRTESAEQVAEIIQPATARARFSPNGKFVEFYDRRQHVQIWDASATPALKDPIPHNGPFDPQMSPTGERIITQADGVVTLRDVQNGEVIGEPFVLKTDAPHL